MTFWQTVGFYMAVGGIAWSLTVIFKVLWTGIDKTGRWFS